MQQTAIPPGIGPRTGSFNKKYATGARTLRALISSVLVFFLEAVRMRCLKDKYRNSILFKPDLHSNFGPSEW